MVNHRYSVFHSKEYNVIVKANTIHSSKFEMIDAS